MKRDERDHPANDHASISIAFDNTTDWYIIIANLRVYLCGIPVHILCITQTAKLGIASSHHNHQYIIIICLPSYDV